MTGIVRRVSMALMAGLLALSPFPAAGQTGSSGGLPPLTTVDGRRVALVIGNSAYADATGWRALDNAADDARYIARTLSDPARGAARFETTLVTDATMEQTVAALREFSMLAENADVALIYYSGHGFHFAGENYIAPVDGPGRVEADDLPQHYVSMREVIGSGYSEGLTILMLDACRNDGPVIARRGTGDTVSASPFGDMDAADAVILFATANGDAAYDAAPPGEPLSPFATALARAISQPGVDIPYVFGAVHQSVREATDIFAPPQRPVYTGSHARRFFFIPAAMADFEPSTALAGTVGTSGQPATRGPGPEAALRLTPRELATIDENNLIGRVLARISMQELRQLAEEGNPVAMSLLGYMLSYGADRQGTQNEVASAMQAEARGWLERAAASGHPAAQLEYGNLLITRGEPGERAAGIALVEQAAAQDFAKAQSYLYSLIQRGLVAGRSAQNERGLLREAAGLGHAWAHYALLLELEAPAEHLAALDALAEAGNPEGDNWLCRAAERPYLAARDVMIADAFDHCLVAANSNYSDSQAVLATRYAEGRGVAADQERARFWARLAAGAPYLEPFFQPRVDAILGRN